MCFGDTGTSKGQTILTLMKKHNIGSAIYIGDTQGDLEACKEAGLPFIFCAYGLGQAESWDAKIEKFEDLLNL
jgi:phosphoglycolate phosphatase